MRLIRIAHIDIDLHWTFLLLFAFVLLAGGFDSALLIIVLFTSVVLHELSHSLVARMHGVRVKRIILLPIGGMSLIEDFAMTPNAELKVAIAGPLLSFVLAALSFAVAAITSNFDLLAPITDIAAYAFQVNVILGVFNLLPALPLDGGRVWRALRQRRRDYLGATRDAVSLSKVIVVVMFLGSIAAALILSAWAFLFWNTILALFIFLGSNMELDAAIFKTSSDGLFVRDVMRKAPATMGSGKSLRDAFILALSSRATSLLVTRTDALPSVISIASLEKIPQKEWHSRKVDSIRQAHIHMAPDTPAIEAWKRMRGAGVELAPVIHKNKLVGVAYSMDIERLIYLKKIALIS